KASGSGAPPPSQSTAATPAAVTPAALQPAAQQPKMIEVAQGSYAVIDANTPADIQGLCTGGMHPCCDITVQGNGVTVLCHADDSTNLRDHQNGLPAWIARVCPNGNYANLRISIGETANGERGGIYYAAATEVLDATLRNTPQANAIGTILTTHNGRENAP